MDGRCGECSDELVLRLIGVLIFIDQHVPPLLLVAMAHLGKAVEQMHRIDQDVVEVERIGSPQRIVICPIHIEHGLAGRDKRVRIAGAPAVPEPLRPLVGCA